MKRWLWLFILFLLAGCNSLSTPTYVYPTQADLGKYKYLQLTSEAATQTGQVPANGETITAIVENKSAISTTIALNSTPVPSQTPVPTIPADSPICQAADLKASAQSSFATGQILLGAQLTNISTKACYLQAWPQASLENGQGQPLNLDYGYYDGVSNDASTIATEVARESATAKVGLMPGWSATLSLDWQNWCGDSIEGGVVIDLLLIDNAGEITIPTGIPTGICSAKGYTSTVIISKITQVTPP